MAPDFEMEAKSNNAIEISATEKNNGSVPQDPHNMPINCASSTSYNTCNTGAFGDGKVKVQNGSEDMEVDIPQCTISGDHGLIEAECQVTTENSSSFGDTMSGSENISALNDVEVESSFCGGGAWASVIDAYNGVLPVRYFLVSTSWCMYYLHPVLFIGLNYEYDKCLNLRS